ncbi:MAG: UDP-N-acetylmuramate--L-alanine ligase [bacterium]|nr:UDP-N-acetylmuramate--L-alanine ligase [bacterium]
MIGIKGVGMTMLAQYFSAKGFVVIGSDIDEKFMTDEILVKLGIKVFEKFSKNNIPCDIDLIIYSTAYNIENNEEVASALASKIKTLTYAQALAEIFNQKYGIAIVGSHGKTTVTAWLGYVLWHAKLDPNVMVGAKVPQFNGSTLVGKSNYLIIEADEYQNKLKYFQPKAVILNNIDYDHPDFFSTKKDYENVFKEFIKKIPDIGVDCGSESAMTVNKGFLVANYDDLTIRKITKVNCKCKIITYGIKKEADYVAYDIEVKDGAQYFKVKKRLPRCLDYKAPRNDKFDELGDFSIQLFGQHNISNALAVIVASIELGIELKQIKKFLGEFQGTTRRLQILGEFQGAIIIDDYAHHPTEIVASLDALRQKYGNKKIIVIFHPHTFTRTKVLLNDFAKSFNIADEVIVLDIYGSAREKHGGVSSEDLVNKLRITNYKLRIKQEIKYIPTLDKCETYLRSQIKKDDVIVLMGAGDVFKIGENLVKK